MSQATTRLWGEFLGTALLLWVIVGSGIAVERLGSDGTGQLFAHAVVVGAGLAALIAFLAPVSGAHFNPAVSLGFWLTRAIPGRTALAYGCVQIAGALVGVAVASMTFGEGLMTVSDTSRNGIGKPFAELIATFVLVLLILGLVRAGRDAMVAPAVGAWVTAIVVATVSTGFANPAVTIARVFTDTFTGVAPASAPAFLIAQCVGGALAAATAVGLFPIRRSSTLELVPSEEAVA